MEEQRKKMFSLDSPQEYAIKYDTRRQQKAQDDYIFFQAHRGRVQAGAMQPAARQQTTIKLHFASPTEVRAIDIHGKSDKYRTLKIRVTA